MCVCVCLCACPQVLDGEGPKDSGITNSLIYCVSDKHTHDLYKYILCLYMHIYTQYTHMWNTSRHIVWVYARHMRRRKCSQCCVSRHMRRRIHIICGTLLDILCGYMRVHIDIHTFDMCVCTHHDHLCAWGTDTCIVCVYIYMHIHTYIYTCICMCVYLHTFCYVHKWLDIFT